MTIAFATSKDYAAPSKRVSAGFIVLYALAFFGLWMAIMTPAVMTLALRVNEIDPANKESNLSWILGVGAIVAMLVNPIVGQLSDRTTSRFGMRKPWMVAGAALVLVALYLMGTGDLMVVAVGWWLMQLAFNAVLATMTAVMPDQVPEEQRGVVSGVLGICLQVGIVGGVYLAQAVGSTFQMFMAPGLIFVVLLAVFLPSFEDRRLKTDTMPKLELIALAKSFWIDPRKAPDFAWAFVSRFMLIMGLATLLTYQVFFLIDKLHFTPDQIPGAMLTATLVTTATTVIGSLLSGWLSDKMQRRKFFVWSSTLIFAAGLAVVGMANDFEGFLWGIAIVGFGQGVYVAVDLALVTQVLPNPAESAKDLGIFNLANALPQTVAPAIAPLFLMIGAEGGKGNYIALFVAAALISAVGALAVIPIRKVK
ncbi:MFS transporter [Roseateles sp. LYH14W]|uniref:MFS transporter n=1 Tax=Pelomonas parva TaxID=3299032 RepID=A0ABW7FA65_9BURK